MSREARPSAAVHPTPGGRDQGTPHLPVGRGRTARWVAALLCGWMVTQAGAQERLPATPDRPFEIEISKSRKELVVKRGSEIEKRFSVALGGGGPGDKRQRGDLRTPVGTYRIIDFNESSRFHIFMHLNYPNVKDAFYGYKGNLISRADFERIVAALKQGREPPQDTALGGAIGIHGIGLASPDRLARHRSEDWTEGCIALTNSEIQELRRYVGVGTKVVIDE